MNRQESPENLEFCHPRGCPKPAVAAALALPINGQTLWLTGLTTGLQVMAAVMAVVHAGDHAVLRTRKSVAIPDEPLLALMRAATGAFPRAPRRRAPGYRSLRQPSAVECGVDLALRQPCRRRDRSRRPCRTRTNRKPGFPMIPRIRFLTPPLVHLSIDGVSRALTEDAVLSPRFGK